MTGLHTTLRPFLGATEYSTDDQDGAKHPNTWLLSMMPRFIIVLPHNSLLDTPDADATPSRLVSGFPTDEL